jgi:hypothetical protein
MSMSARRQLRLRPLLVVVVVVVVHCGYFSRTSRSIMTSIVGGALARRTLPKMADEKIGLAMTKWWKKKRPVEAEVSLFLL